MNNKGKVRYCYYLAASAQNPNGEVSGAGTKNGSTDSVSNLDIGWFKGWVLNVNSHYYGSGGTLINVLNAWQEAYVNNGYPLAYWWVTTDNGYPIPYKD